MRPPFSIFQAGCGFFVFPRKQYGRDSYAASLVLLSTPVPAC